MQQRGVAPYSQPTLASADQYVVNNGSNRGVQAVRQETAKQVAAMVAQWQKTNIAGGMTIDIYRRALEGSSDFKQFAYELLGRHMDNDLQFADFASLHQRLMARYNNDIERVVELGVALIQQELGKNVTPEQTSWLRRWFG